jgi:prepilin-type N-terminal cleavage/methylation domain-containing protein
MSRIVMKRERGFSLIELLVVMIIMAILAGITIFAFAFHKRAYRPEDAANQIVSFMREAYQLAITQRQTFRVKIDQKNRTISLIDENRLPLGDEVVIRQVNLIDQSEVRMDQPGFGTPGVVGPPPAPYNYPPAIYNNGIWEIRFRSDGSAVDASGSPLSATLFFWPPSRRNPGGPSPDSKQEIRAVTVFGPSGSIKFWRHDGNQFFSEQR